MKRRLLTYPLIILFFYLFRAVDFFPFETNFDFTRWENSKFNRWIILSIIGVLVEEYFIRKKPSKPE
ncbi:MAG: hypothetical protein CMD32_02105 [Flavobacteriales bacterium]|jgi:hypothetical protein|nr:hypothetical protein [Flavobacteriales bacterium]|tara:strand:+ start:410 stop:610 length:201 start_codon:yes stop_codon:yes gene_type:complete